MLRHYVGACWIFDELDEKYCVWHFCTTTIINHLSHCFFCYLKLMSAVIKNTESSAHQPRSEEALSTLQSSWHRVVFLMLATFNKHPVLELLFEMIFFQFSDCCLNRDWESCCYEDVVLDLQQCLGRWCVSNWHPHEFQDPRFLRRALHCKDMIGVTSLLSIFYVWLIWWQWLWEIFSYNFKTTNRRFGIGSQNIGW